MCGTWVMWGRTYRSICATKFNINLLVAKVEDVYWCIWHFDRFGVTTLALGSWPKQGLARVGNKREAQEAHLILLKVQESVREWILTLPRQLPLGELESRWTPKFSRSNCRGQNPLV
jgi:hypothetical protein